MGSIAFYMQVEILDSYFQTLHRLHGEQVGATSQLEWQRPWN